MSRQKIYAEIIETPFKFLTHGIKKFKHPEITNSYNSWQELYDYLNPNIDKICECNGCNKNKKFKSFTKGYNKFCSIKCNNKWLSYSRIGDKNPVHRMTDESRKNMGLKNSKNLKKLIKEGKFTPSVTNSWCHSKIKIKFNRGDDEIIQNVRSSWEAFFQLLNKDYKYEKLRIPYLYNKEWHTYIVDFIDDVNKVVVEVKPNNQRLIKKNIIKETYLIKWCKDNNYTYKVISEDYFKKLDWDNSLIEKQPDYGKLSNPRFKKYFNIQ